MTFIYGLITGIAISAIAYVLKIKPDLRNKVEAEIQAEYDALTKKKP